MAKKILVSNSGSYQEISAAFDDNNALSSSYKLTINTASYVGGNSIMQIRNGQLIPVATSSIVNPQSNYSGSVLTYDSDEGFGPFRTELAQFAGDITGSLLSGVKVRSVSNVTGGVLSSLYGGTSNTTYTQNSLITTTGSGPAYGQSDKIVAVIDNNGTWDLADKSILEPSFTPMTGIVVYLFTGSIGTSSASSTVINNWLPPAGCKFIRVICQGGGGGGGGASMDNGAILPGAGGGGGGGGYSDVTINALLINSYVTITAGNGGSLGRAGYISGQGEDGYHGGSSSFGNYVYSLGGTAGGRGIGSPSPVNGAGGAGGIGYSYNGGAGGGLNVAGANVYLGGAGGAGGVGRTSNGLAGGLVTSVLTVAATGGTVGSNTVLATDGGPPQTGKSFLFYKLFINNVLSENMPDLVGGGGASGGGRRTTSLTGLTLPVKAGDSSSGMWGSGGGGGSIYDGPYTANGGNGGDGGKGYVLIICS